MTNLKLQDYLVLNQNKSSIYLKPFTIEELMALIGLLLLTGVFHASRESLSDLYSDDINKSKPIFKATMGRDRLKSLLRFLRFDDASTRLNRIKTDKLAPIRSCFELINSALAKCYTPGKWITVDEHLCRYRGRCSFKQYMPNKPDRYGIKMWVLADAKTFYPITIEVFTGAGHKSISNKPEDVVHRLASKLPPGCVLVGDNYFTSLSLCRRLFTDNKIGYLGTMRGIRREIPNCLKETKSRTLYSSNFIFTNDGHILVSYMAKKTKNVLLLTNIHSSTEISMSPKNKPKIILDYNSSKSGVDKLDQLIKEYRSYRATRRWPCVIFYDLIGFASQAVWVIYCKKFPTDKLVLRKARKQFLYTLGKQLVNPQIVKRKNSKSFPFFNKLIKAAINEATTDTIPTISSIISQSLETLPISVIDGIEIIPDVSLETPINIFPTTVDQPSNSLVCQTPATVVKKRGRCVRCDRSNDKKIVKTCHLCENFICQQHSKVCCICDGCQDTLL